MLFKFNIQKERHVKNLDHNFEYNWYQISKFVALKALLIKF